MKKIVRVRYQLKVGGDEDIKVTVTGRNNKYDVIWEPIGSTSIKSEYDLKDITQPEKDDFQKNLQAGNRLYVVPGFNPNYYSDVDILINKTILSYEKINNRKYEIVQDPWDDNPPIRRSFGHTPYYLNNGASINISWIDKNTGLDCGGVRWSDDDGNELDRPKAASEDYTKSYITKSVIIYAASGGELLSINKDDKLTNYDIDNQKEYTGLTRDIDIVNTVVDKWKNIVPNYNIKLNDPNYIESTTIEYVSPILGRVSSDSPSTQAATEASANLDQAYKVKMNLIIDPIVKVKQDFSIILSIPGGDFDFGEEDQYVQDDEYSERQFNGQEMSITEVQYSEETRVQVQSEADIINNIPYVPGKYTLDFIPGVFVTNNANIKIRCCQINGYPVNVNIADALLDLINDAKKGGISITVGSGFRSPYDAINTKSESGVKVESVSQEYLYDGYKAGKPGFNLAAEPTKSAHGSGTAIDFNTGSKIKGTLNNKVYTWLVKNSWRFGFIRTVPSEEWHFDYLPTKAKKGPYGMLAGTDANLFYSSLKLNNLQIV